MVDRVLDGSGAGRYTGFAAPAVRRSGQARGGERVDGFA